MADYPTPEPVAELDGIADWVHRYEKAKHTEKIARETADEAKIVITALLEEQGAEFGTLGGRAYVRYRTITSNRVDPKMLRTEYPEIAEKVTKQSVSKRLDLLTENEAQR